MFKRHHSCAGHGSEPGPVPGAGPVRAAPRRDRATAPVYLLPDAAVVLDQSQRLVMTVAPDATVKPKIVTTGQLAADCG